MKNAKGWDEKNTFGSSIDYGDLLLKETDLVVLCEMTPNGHKPKQLLLPHQIYKENLDPKKRYCIMQVAHTNIVIAPEVKNADNG